MKILFIVPYPYNSAPSQRLKFEQYFDYLRQHGIELEISSFISPEFMRILYKRGHILKKIIFTIAGYLKRVCDIFKARNCDIIYLHLEAAPFGPPIFEYIFFMMKKPVIYDIDDVVYIPHASEVNRYMQFLKFPQKVSRIIRSSKRVVVVTHYLKQFAERFNKNVVCIPPAIDTDKYYVKRKYETDTVCIGWTGSHSTVKYLFLLEGALKRISQMHKVKIKVIGDRSFKIDGLAIEAKDWSLDTELQDIQEIDIGLYPLPKNEWIMGKGGLKALQYMGMGIPVVCTRIGEVLYFIQDDINGFLAGSEEEWVKKISRLINDLGLRKKIGLSGRKTVEEKFSVKANAPKYLNLIRGVL